MVARNSRLRLLRRGDLEADACPLGVLDLVERGPLLPAVTLGDRFAVDHPRAGLAVTSLDQTDPLHQVDQHPLVDGSAGP